MAKKSPQKKPRTKKQNAVSSPKDKPGSQEKSGAGVKKKKVGRPSTYNESIGKRICAAYAMCKDGIEKVCDANPDFPNAATIYDWRNNFPEFDKMYARAREAKAEYISGLIVEVAFDESGDEVPFYGQVHVQRDKLKFDALRWQASKLDPRKYSDKVDLTTGGDKLPAAPAPINLTPEIIKKIDKALDEDL